MVKMAKTSWHLFFGSALYELLTNIGIEVNTEYKVIATPPIADVVLIRRVSKKWTSEQKERLPDGIRDVEATHIILEFKYTESFTTQAMIQSIGYDWNLKCSLKEKLFSKKVETFIILSKTPSIKTLDLFGYQPSKYKGVYKTNHEGWSLITVISLNDLSDKPHNAYIKIFASKKREKNKALMSLYSMGLNNLPYRLNNLYQGLINIWYGQIKEVQMNVEMTPENVMEIGKIWGDAFLSTLTTDDRLKLVEDIPVHERFKDISVHDRLKLVEDIPVHERIKDIPVHERFEDISLSELEALIKSAKMKKGIK